MNRVAGSIGFENHKMNMNVLLNELKRFNPPDEVFDYKPSDIMYSDEVKLKILEFMYEISRNDTKTVKEKPEEMFDDQYTNDQLDFDQEMRRDRNNKNQQYHVRSESPNTEKLNQTGYSETKAKNEREGSTSVKPIKPKRAWGNANLALSNLNSKPITNIYSPKNQQQNIQENDIETNTIDNRKMTNERNALLTSQTSSVKKPSKPPVAKQNVSSAKKFSNNKDQLVPMVVKDTSNRNKDAYVDHQNSSDMLQLLNKHFPAAEKEP